MKRGFLEKLDALSYRQRVFVAAAVFGSATLLVTFFSVIVKVRGGGLVFLLFLPLTALLFPGFLAGLYIGLASSLVSLLAVLLFYHVQHGSVFEIKFLPAVILPDLLYLVLAVFFSLFTSMRREITSRIKSSEEKYRQLVESALVGVYIFQEGKIKFVNKKILEILGYSFDEMLKMKWQDFIHKDDQPKIAENIHKKLKKEVPFTHLEFRALRKDRKIIFLEVFSSVISYEGKPAIFGTLLDITERKKSEEKLKSLYDALIRKKEELERINRAFVGREIKMIELKKEIQKLKAKAK